MLADRIKTITIVWLAGYKLSGYEFAHAGGSTPLRRCLIVCADLIEVIDHDINHVLLGLLDQSAAVEVVDQDILIECLSGSYGIRLTALWFRSYLTKLKQSVQFKGNIDYTSPQVQSPQGPVLGSWLFFLYTAGLWELM